MPAVIPDFVTHYYRAGGQPFLNLSDLTDDQVSVVIGRLESDRTQGLSARVFGRRYMELRRRTEAKLRALFVEVGGKPERSAPHYFVLGSSAWYGGLANDMRAIVLGLNELPSDVCSFTYPDSFTAMALGAAYGLSVDPRPYHELVYRIERLPEVIGTYGLPPDGVDEYDGYQHKPFEKYVEVQLWSDEPLQSILRRYGPANMQSD
jgi:hypothetical protein